MKINLNENFVHLKWLRMCEANKSEKPISDDKRAREKCDLEEWNESIGIPSSSTSETHPTVEKERQKSSRFYAFIN